MSMTLAVSGMLNLKSVALMAKWLRVLMRDNSSFACGCARHFFSGIIPFSPHLLSGLSHMS